MADLRNPPSEAETAVQQLIRAAAGRTTPPGPFDLTAAVELGRRRVARHRLQAVIGVALVAAAVAAVAALPTLGERPPPPPTPAETPTPTPSDWIRGELSERAAIQELVARRYTSVGDTQFAGPAVSATMIRGCDKDLACDSVVLLTTDGWRTNVAYTVPGAGYVSTQLLPDGSVAFVPDETDADTTAGVLHPDGRVSPLRVSTEPTPITEGSVLTREPVLDIDEPTQGPWVVDPGRATLRPLRTKPDGQAVFPPVVAADGTVFVATHEPGPPPADVTIARSQDEGRTWEYTKVTARTTEASMLAYQAIGPDGRMAVVFSSDGATLSPLVELWTTTDAGLNWSEMRPQRRPRTISGMAYAPDGTLLLADDQQTRLWRSTPDGSDLEPATELPDVASIESSGGVLFGQIPTGRRHRLAVSVDGRDWQAVSLPADIRD